VSSVHVDLSTGNARLSSVLVDLSSGNAGLSSALVDLSSGNAGLSSIHAALSAGNAGLSTGNHAVSAENRRPTTLAGGWGWTGCHPGARDWLRAQAVGEAIARGAGLPLALRDGVYQPKMKVIDDVNHVPPKEIRAGELKQVRF
jgi:hypothetical protein